MRVCFFESLAADLKPKERNLKNLLVCLLKNELVSTFDVSELKWLRMLISDAEKMNFIVEKNENYPYHRFALTETGIKFINDHTCARSW